MGDRPTVWAGGGCGFRRRRDRVARGRASGGRRVMKEYVADWEALQRTDPEIARAIVDELGRERSMLRLIASENYTSPAVLAALGSTMGNKYAEGYPGRRYYGGLPVRRPAPTPPGGPPEGALRPPAPEVSPPPRPAADPSGLAPPPRP